MALVRPGWATAVPPAFQGGASPQGGESPQGGDWYESAVLPAFPADMAATDIEVTVAVQFALTR